MTKKWSFSRLNAFNTCKYMFYITYIEGNRGEDNSFAQYGTLVHDILEKYATGEYLIFELSDKFIDNFNKVITYDFPPNKFVDLKENYFKQGKAYFDNFDGWEMYKIITAEEEVEFKIDGYKLGGFIDLLVRNVLTDELEVIDHKSKSGFKNKEEKNHYLLQLYLYSIPIKEKYGQYPNKLKFNMFRKGKWEEEEFKYAKLEMAKQWVIDTIKNIEKETEFAPTKDDFFCKYLCSHRNTCQYNQEELDVC